MEPKSPPVGPVDGFAKNYKDTQFTSGVQEVK